MINEVGDSADEECYSSLNYNSTVPEYSKLKIDDASLASHRPRPRPPPAAAAAREKYVVRSVESYYGAGYKEMPLVQGA